MNTPELTTLQELHAPWNETNNPMMRFDVSVTQTLSKDDTIGTEDYICHEYDCDDIDSSGVNWEQEWKKQHYSITQLLRILEDYLTDELDGKPRKYHSQGCLLHILQECKGWNIEETYVEGG